MTAALFPFGHSLIKSAVMILTIYEILLTLGLCSAMGVFCGLLSYFLDYCFLPGSIFQWYLPFIGKLVLKRERPSGWDVMLKSGPDTYIPAVEHKFWFKILGGCSVCFNIWLAMMSFVLICGISFLPWWGCFPYILTSSWIIRKLVGAD